MRFLITRLSAIGDCVHTLPLANLIKQRWPQAFVAWAVEPGAASLVKPHAAVDETIVVPKGFLRSPRKVLAIARQLRSLRIDITLDPQSLTKSAALAWLSGARRRIGFAKPAGRELAPWLNSERVVPRERHVVRRYLELLRPLDVEADASEIDFAIARDSAAENRVQRFLATLELGEEFAVINPGAGWDSKVWPAERYGAVARQLALRSVVVWSGEKERAWAESIVAGSHGRAQLAPATTLPELAGLLRRARLFIGSDTGPLHLAAAVNTPCVALFGPTRPEVCGPYGLDHSKPCHRVLQVQHRDLGWQRKQAGQTADAMLAIQPDEVVAATEEMLADFSAISP